MWKYGAVMVTENEPLTAREHPPSRRRRVLLVILCVVMLAPVGLVLTAQGADSWCTGEGFRRSSAFGQELTMSAWPPGVRCTLEFDGDKTSVYWPIDW